MQFAEMNVSKRSRSRSVLCCIWCTI